MCAARSPLLPCECNRLQNVHVKYGMIETYQTIRTKRTENCLSILKHIRRRMKLGMLQDKLVSQLRHGDYPTSRATARVRSYYTTNRPARPIYRKGAPLRSPWGMALTLLTSM